jgi:hypothetical protein
MFSTEQAAGRRKGTFMKAPRYPLWHPVSEQPDLSKTCIETSLGLVASPVGQGDITHCVKPPHLRLSGVAPNLSSHLSLGDLEKSCFLRVSVPL